MGLYLNTYCIQICIILQEADTLATEATRHGLLGYIYLSGLPLVREK